MVHHRLEEIRSAVTKEGKGQAWVADEGPEHPAHLRSHQSKDDHPDAENHAHMRPKCALVDSIDGRGLGRGRQWRRSGGIWLDRQFLLLRESKAMQRLKQKHQS